MELEQVVETIILIQKSITQYLDRDQHDLAHNFLNDQLSLIDINDDSVIPVLAELAGSYISLGSEAFDSNLVEKGVVMMVENRERILKEVSESSFNYNMGNAFDSLYQIKIRSISDYFPTPEYVKEELFQAKQYFFKAYKKIDLHEITSLDIMVLNNLGNNLISSGRIIEAIQIFRTVLKFQPNFTYSQVSLSDALLFYMKISNSHFSVSLYAEIYSLVQKALESVNLPGHIHNRLKSIRSMCIRVFDQESFSTSSIEEELELSKSEYNLHSKELKFYLDNFLSLSEHSLYCFCNGAKTCDLSIGYPGFVATNPKIRLLELSLSRIKSEYALAQFMYFKYLNSKTEDNIHYENLGLEELNGLHFEHLRMSFRYCFGIFDKIAENLCFLFDLEVKESEAIFFDTFWNSRRVKTRWAEINKIQNIHLTALYGIASDLSKSNGEFAFYKIWRNRLEHGIYSLTINENPEFLQLEVPMFTSFSTLKHFEEKTLSLLQLSRAAIFSFTLCARQEMIV